MEYKAEKSIITALELGVDIDVIKNSFENFVRMIRFFDNNCK